MKDMRWEWNWPSLIPVYGKAPWFDFSVDVLECDAPAEINPRDVH